MGKLGLCACYDNHNYGSMLQALATCKALDRLGVDYELVRYRRKLTAARVAQLIAKAFTLDAWAGLITDMKWKLYLKQNQGESRRQRARSDAFQAYCNERFGKLGPVFDGYKSLCDGSDRYSAVMVGSDQLWLPSGFTSKYYTLEFAVEGVRRISYATSFGISEMPTSSVSAARKFLSEIDYLSVREKSGVDIVDEVTNGTVGAHLVVDPTLLFNREGWKEIIPDRRLVKEPYIFCYFLGINPNSRKMAKELKDKTGLPVVMLRNWRYHLIEDEVLDDSDSFTMNPDDFVNLIRHADYVLTDSFHGTVFSLLNHKHFGTFYRDASGANSRNTRIDSLFDQLNVKSRLMNDRALSDYMKMDVDYDRVDVILEEWRRDSLSFLEEAVNGI